ncbi:MAG: type I-E CRISPR-associated protein Cas7/Cse4/CasC [Anaerolineales bacterium]
MLIELHLIQNFAPSNLNRDDTGNPKDAEFGGVRRARISSQAFKRAIRLHPVFARTTEIEPAVRTRLIVRRLNGKLQAAGKNEEEARAVAVAMAEAYAGKAGKMDGNRTRVLLYLSKEEIESLAAGLLENWDAALQAAQNSKDKKAQENAPFTSLVKDLIKATKNRTSAPDIALFGRMLADKPEINLDAACQVAHAISTHRVSMDLDFFTAVDDLQRDEESGAGMMGTTAFNSACFYRYIAIDWEQLVQNLDGDHTLARKTVEGFLRAALQAIPSGKQNAFAAQNPPDFVLAVRNAARAPRSLANAFEKPVRPNREGGLVEPSIQALDAYWASLAAIYGQDGLEPAALSLRPAAAFSNLQGAAKANLEDWLQSVLQGLGEE